MAQPNWETGPLVKTEALKIKGVAVDGEEDGRLQLLEDGEEQDDSGHEGAEGRVLQPCKGGQQGVQPDQDGPRDILKMINFPYLPQIKSYEVDANEARLMRWLIIK